MTEIKHRLWELTKITLGATAGYFFRAYRDKEEYKKARIGLFKGSALIFATYMTFNSVAPRCTAIVDEYSKGNQRIEEKKLDHEFQRDTMKIRRGLSANEVRKDIRSSIDEQIAPLYESQQDIAKKIDPLYSTQHEVRQRVESMQNTQEEQKKGLEQVAVTLSRLEQEIKTPKKVFTPVPTPMVTAMDQETASGKYRTAINEGSVVGNNDKKFSNPIVSEITYYRIILDKSDGEAILTAISSNNMAQVIGRYAASQPQNETPNGTYRPYRLMRSSNDRYPGYIFFNEHNPHCGISGAGLNDVHSDEITRRQIANRNGWRVNNTEFETIYAKASKNRLLIHVQE